MESDYITIRIKKADKAALDRLRAEGQSRAGIVSELVRFFLGEGEAAGNPKAESKTAEPCSSR